MKIEKLTEDKIRIIVNPSDLELENLDMKSIMTKSIDRQGFFVHMLEKAKDEVGFNTDGCKLLIEAFSSSDDILVFTITKYSEKEPLKNIDSSKKLTVKRKSLNIKNKEAIYRFRSFDEIKLEVILFSNIMIDYESVIIIQFVLLIWYFFSY